MRSEDGGVQAVGGCETGVGIAKAETGPGKQARSQKQHQREGNLCRQCREAQAQASTGYSDARERGGEAVAAPLPGRQEPEEQGSQERHDAVEDKHACVHGHIEPQHFSERETGNDGLQ